jgi:peroxiredoxin
MRNICAVVAVIFFLSALSSCEKREPEQDAKPQAAVGSSAPDFVLKDLTGKAVRLSDYLGKIVLLEFWATWCPPCKAAVPELVSLQSKYDEIGFVVLGVSIDEGGNRGEKLTEFAEEYKINYLILLGDDEVSRTYSVRSIPTSFLIDRSGRIVEVYMGYIDTLEAKISEQVENID